MKTPLTILHIVGELNPNDLGGAEVHIVEVIRGLARKGHHQHVFVGQTDRCKVLFPFDNVTVHPVRCPQIPNLKLMLYIPAALRKIRRFLKSHRVDVIHSKQVFTLGVIGARLHRTTGIPHYLTVKNPLAYKEELVLPLPFVPAFINRWIQETLKPIAQYALRRASALACVSTYSKTRSLEMAPRARAEIVPNGVDTSQFYPPTDAKARGIEKRFKIVTTSTLIPRNGIDILIRAFGLLMREHPHAHLTIAGEGPLEKELRALVKQLRIDQHVDFIGTLRHDQVPDLLRQSDLFVRPSRAEGFGVSFIEAMACGLPVVTCPSGGILDFVKEGETGRLVPPNDPEALAKAVTELMKNTTSYDHISKQALILVKERYSWESIVDRVEEIYQDIVE